MLNGALLGQPQKLTNLHDTLGAECELLDFVLHLGGSENRNLHARIVHGSWLCVSYNHIKERADLGWN